MSKWSEEDRREFTSIVEEVVQRSLRPLETKVEILTAKQMNTTIGRKDRINKVPNDKGELPGDDMFPHSIQVLIGGQGKKKKQTKRQKKEPAQEDVVPNVPSEPEPNLRWNAKMSNRLLRFYGQEGSDSESGEETEPSRAKRLMVAKQLGITRSQLNYAQWDL
jgi:hypothetical protein